MITTTEQVRAAKTAELVAFYNQATGKSIKKFSSRAAAEKQCIAVLPTVAVDVAAEVAVVVAAEEPAPAKDNFETTCPECGESREITAAGPEGTFAGENHNFCHNCSHTWNRFTGKAVKPRKPGTNNAAGVSESWKNPMTYQARVTRDGVEVEGKGQFRSVRQAFLILNLPLTKHIGFRKDLKKQKALEFMGLKFKII